MADILISEYRAWLAEAGALFICDPPDPVQPESRSWTAPLGGMRATISLTHAAASGERRFSMQPQIHVNGAVFGDGLAAVVVLADAQTTLQRALSCFLQIRGHYVWIRNCPCGSCSAGNANGRPCPVCGGSGLRQEPEAPGAG